MFESRCGVLCNSCERREQVNCKGCTNMSAPFWGGECKVKACCENKGLNHCGECSDFPCEMLSNMGKEQGFDPSAKIEQCRRWLELQEQERLMDDSRNGDFYGLNPNNIHVNPWERDKRKEGGAKTVQVLMDREELKKMLSEAIDKIPDGVVIECAEVIHAYLENSMNVSFTLRTGDNEEERITLQNYGHIVQGLGFDYSS